MTSRSVSITGATGFVGYHLAQKFQESGWTVRAVVRPGSAKPLPEGVAAVQAPLVKARLEPAFAGADLVVHAAAAIRAPSDLAFVATNVDGTRAVVEAANAAGARLLHLSSVAAIGPASAAAPAREDDAPHPINGYGRSKLAGEEVVRTEARTPWTIVRPSAVYGPRDRGFLPLFRMARRGLFLYAAPPATAFTFVHVEDLVDALLRAASDDRAIGRTFFVGHPEPVTTEVLLRTIAEAEGKPYRPRSVAPIALDAAAALGELAWRIGRPPLLDRGRLAELQSGGFVCAVDRIRDGLGFVATIPIRDGIERTARAYRECGWL
ncbi:MAG TPA: NAD(P)-dependent oxidoreductase [Vicinamibacterales bacterium]|jgi:nucleoside-diphosphate-sugar epimerase